MIYRGFRFGRKRNLKITHATIHALAFLFAVFGLIAVFDSHNYALPKIPNLYSLHSWIGIASVGLFICQYLFGFFCYLFPMVREPMKVFYMPIHVFCGLLGYALALGAALLGLSEKAFFAMKNDYSQLPNQALLGKIFIIIL
jgi:cytochrome b-561